MPDTGISTTLVHDDFTGTQTQSPKRNHLSTSIIRTMSRVITNRLRRSAT